MIETQRLELIPLTPRLLRLWVEDISALEKELNICYEGEEMDEALCKIVQGQLCAIEAHPESYIWYTFWLILRKSDRIVVGSADFKGMPNENGETEIGYGMDKRFEHNGYMTEAVAGMCRWALAQDGVAGVVAETLTDNLASQRVLARCGFEVYKRGDNLWWKLEKQQ